MAKYKNISNLRVFISGVGAVEPGEVLETDKLLRSPYLKLVQNESKKIKESKLKEKK